MRMSIGLLVHVVAPQEHSIVLLYDFYICLPRL